MNLPLLSKSTLTLTQTTINPSVRLPYSTPCSRSSFRSQFYQDLAQRGDFLVVQIGQQSRSVAADLEGPLRHVSRTVVVEAVNQRGELVNGQDRVVDGVQCVDEGLVDVRCDVHP